MAKIQSDASLASSCATSIQTGANGITSVGKATKIATVNIQVRRVPHYTLIMRPVKVDQLQVN